MPDNPSTSQHSQYIDPTPLQNALSLINSLNINISSPQTVINIMPIPTDMQDQLRQGHNHFPSQSQFQQ